MEAPRLDVVGLAFVAAMHALFALLAADHGPLDMVLAVLGLAGILAAAWGLATAPRRAGLIALATGLGLLATVRGTHLGLDVATAPTLVSANGGLLTLALASAALSAGRWAWRPHDAETRSTTLRAAFALAAATTTLDMMMSLSSGDLGFTFGLLLGAVGYALAAPNVAPPRAGGRVTAGA